MEISIYSQLITNLYSIFIGCFCWVLYELIKLIKMIFYWDFSEKFRLKMGKKEYKSIKNPLNIKIKGDKKIRFVVTLVFDIIYFVILSIIFPIFIFVTNDGIFRWYIFAFAFLGYIVPKATLGRLLNFVLEHINYYSRVLILLIITPINNKITNIRKKLRRNREENVVKKSQEKREKSRNILISYGK